MARPLRITYPGAYYHVTSRGNERRDIYKSRRDREKFLTYLESASERHGALIHAYCLMSNHYHLILETPAGNLSEIMQHINGAYTTYFNVKRKRAGRLFQGRHRCGWRLLRAARPLGVVSGGFFVGRIADERKTKFCP